MKTFGKFLRESSQMQPGAVVMLINGQAFTNRTMYGVSNGRVIFKVTGFHQEGPIFKGTVTQELLETYDHQVEVLQQGIQRGDMILSHLQLDVLPTGSLIESGNDQYKKIDQSKWVKMGEGAIRKYDSFHFDPALKYIWKS